MNSIKRAMSAAVLGLAVIGGGAAFADDTALTEDEKKTISIAHEFSECMTGKLATITSEEIDETVQALIDSGYLDTIPPEQRGAVMQQYLQQMFITPARSECASEMGIDLREVGQKLQVIVEKHGPDVLKPPAP